MLCVERERKFHLINSGNLFIEKFDSISHTSIYLATWSNELVNNVFSAPYKFYVCPRHDTHFGRKKQCNYHGADHSQAQLCALSVMTVFHNKKKRNEHEMLIISQIAALVRCLKKKCRQNAIL